MFCGPSLERRSTTRRVRGAPGSNRIRRPALLLPWPVFVCFVSFVVLKFFALARRNPFAKIHSGLGGSRQPVQNHGKTFFPTVPDCLLLELGHITRMELPDDITARIRRDFSGADAVTVEQRLLALSQAEPDLFGERILRCIIFASRGRLSGVEHCIAMTREDPRDMIVTAEYDRDEKHIRHFSQPFENVA